MARANAKETSDAPRDAIALLKQDHRAVEALFGEFEDADEDEQPALALRICQMLTVHTQIEEEILYPAAKDALSEDENTEDLVPEAEVEHASAKDLIAKIEEMTPEDEAFKATLKVLSEYVKHHVKEEETEMFPALKQTELDLKQLGAKLAERKFALMDEMGIDAEEPPAARKRSAGGRAKSGARGGRKSTRSSSRTARH